MGASVGISINSDVRIATSKSMFAMPEAELGLFTDIGASYFLPRAVNDELCFGLYLALTGKRIIGKDLVKWGLATHYIADDKIEELKQTIISKVTPSITNSEIFKIVNNFADTNLGSDFPNVDRKSFANSIENAESIREVFKPDSAAKILERIKLLSTGSDS